MHSGKHALAEQLAKLDLRRLLQPELGEGELAEQPAKFDLRTRLEPELEEGELVTGVTIWNENLIDRIEFSTDRGRGFEAGKARD